MIGPDGEDGQGYESGKMPTVLEMQREVKWSLKSGASLLLSRCITPCGGGWEAHSGK